MIFVIGMNFYIWSHSTDESDKEEYMEFSKKCCIGCMPGYTYSDYVYFNTSIDAPKDHNNILILNKKQNIYITSLLKLMDDTFTSLPKFFVD